MNEQQQYELVCKPTLERIEGYCRKMFNILEGQDGEEGLVTEVARHDERIIVLQKWRKWAIGLGTTIVAGIIVALIIFALTHK